MAEEKHIQTEKSPLQTVLCSTVLLSYSDIKFFWIKNLSTTSLLFLLLNPPLFLKLHMKDSAATTLLRLVSQQVRHFLY